MEYKKFSTTLISVFVLAGMAFARAGGGGSSGGGTSKGIGAIISLINLGLIIYFVYRKNKKAKKIIHDIHNTDSLWDYDKMIDFANVTFSRMQNAWMERNMELVKDIVTERLFNEFQKELNWQKVKHEQNIIEDIELKKTEIIGLEDHTGKDTDSFTVYIKGRLVDYTISDKTQKVYTNSSKSSSSFVDLYYFVRQEDKWVLDRVDNKVTLGKIFKAKEIVD